MYIVDSMGKAMSMSHPHHRTLEILRGLPPELWIIMCPVWVIPSMRNLLDKRQGFCRAETMKGSEKPT